MEQKYTREERWILQQEQIQNLIEDNGGLVKTSQLTALGIDYRRILSLVEEGRLQRVKSGYYSMNYSNYSEEEMIVKMFPDGILTMESALYYYGYLKDKPYAWSIAVSKNTSKSRFKIDYPIVHPFYAESQVLSLGVTSMPIAGHDMKIYTKDRLICDVLKYEEKMNREDFKKAALTYINDEDKDIAQLMECAKERKVLRKVQSMIGVWL